VPVCDYIDVCTQLMINGVDERVVSEKVVAALQTLSTDQEM